MSGADTPTELELWRPTLPASSFDERPPVFDVLSAADSRSLASTPTMKTSRGNDDGAGVWSYAATNTQTFILNFVVILFYFYFYVFVYNRRIARARPVDFKMYRFGQRHLHAHENILPMAVVLAMMFSVF